MTTFVVVVVVVVGRSTVRLVCDSELSPRRYWQGSGEIPVVGVRRWGGGGRGADKHEDMREREGLTDKH